MMIQYNEQILFAGEARIHTAPIKRLGRLIITEKRLFFIPKKAWLKWGDIEAHQFELQNLAELSLNEDRLLLHHQNQAFQFSGQDIKSAHGILIDQRRVLAMDKIPVPHQTDEECLLLFQEMKVDGENALVILTHQNLYISGKEPFEGKPNDIPTPSRKEEGVLLRLNKKKREIIGEESHHLATLISVIQAGYFPRQPPINGMVDNQQAYCVPCRQGLAIDQKGIRFIQFEAMTSLIVEDADALISYLDKKQLISHRISAQNIVTICSNGFLDRKRVRKKECWSEPAICFESITQLRLGILSYQQNKLTWDPCDNSMGWCFSGFQCSKDAGEDDLLRIRTPIGPMTLELATGRAGQAALWMFIEDDMTERPFSPVAEFINMRASIRLSINKPTKVIIEETNNLSQITNTIETHGLLLDISFGGCALGMNHKPISLNSKLEETLFEILIPLQNKKISVQGIIGNVIEVNNVRYSHRYGIQFINLTTNLHREIFNEALRLEREQLIKMESN